jgi:hypothetical protein
MNDQANVVEILSFDDADDVGDVDVKIYALIQQTRTLAQSRQGW